MKRILLILNLIITFSNAYDVNGEYLDNFNPCLDSALDYFDSKLNDLYQQDDSSQKNIAHSQGVRLTYKFIKASALVKIINDDGYNIFCKNLETNISNFNKYRLVIDYIQEGSNEENESANIKDHMSASYFSTNGQTEEYGRYYPEDGIYMELNYYPDAFSDNSKKAKIRLLIYFIKVDLNRKYSYKKFRIFRRYDYLIQYHIEKNENGYNDDTITLADVVQYQNDEIPIIKKMNEMLEAEKNNYEKNNKNKMTILSNEDGSISISSSSSSAQKMGIHDHNATYREDENGTISIEQNENTSEEEKSLIFSIREKWEEMKQGLIYEVALPTSDCVEHCPLKLQKYGVDVDICEEISKMLIEADPYIMKIIHIFLAFGALILFIRGLWI